MVSQTCSLDMQRAQRVLLWAESHVHKVGHVHTCSLDMLEHLSVKHVALLKAVRSASCRGCRTAGTPASWQPGGARRA